jgi:hypothetical protein
MADDGKSAVRLALEHVQKGRAKIKRQYELIGELRRDGHSIEEAERILIQLENLQIELESHYHKLLNDSQEKLRASGYKNPTKDGGDR